MASRKSSYPDCPAQIACEGSPIKTGRGMCGACERTLEKRNKIVGKLKALKGEYYMDTKEPERG